MITLETERLILRMLCEDDFEDFAELCADPDVVRYLGEGVPLSRENAWRQMATILGHWQLRGYGPWAVEERESGKVIGRIGFFNPEGWPGFELGWVLRKDRWGRGYAREGAGEALRHAFNVWKREKVISLIQPANEPSIRVALRLGYRLDGSTEVLGKHVQVYSIDADSWRKREV